MLLAYFGASTALADMPWAQDSLVRYALAVALMFLVTLVHELGHAAAVVRVGGTIKSIMVFPLQWRVGRRRLGFAKLSGQGDVGGFVSYSLNRINPRRKHMIVASAGPTANLAAAAVAVMVAQADIFGAVSAMVVAFALLSLGTAVANLLPFAGSDGSIIARGLFRAQARP